MENLDEALVPGSARELADCDFKDERRLGYTTAQILNPLAAISLRFCLSLLGVGVS